MPARSPKKRPPSLYERTAVTDPLLHLLVHVGLTLAAVWPAHRLLRRAGLPRWWLMWLALPLAGPAIFATLLAFRRWPNVPPPPPRLHSRERLRRQREGLA